MKRLLSVFVVIAIVLLTGQSIMAAEGEGFEENDTYLPKYESEAKLLHQYGLLTGTDKGFELDKPLTRLEGAVMVARLLGEEKAVQNGEYDHLEIPFTDVPEWGEGYVKYLASVVIE